MSKFTQGNWMVADCLDEKQYRTLAVWKGFETDGERIICLVSPKEVETEEDYANAQLIAIAPEMYEAMQEFCDRVDKGEVRSTKTYAKFKEILAKVE